MPRCAMPWAQALDSQATGQRHTQGMEKMEDLQQKADTLAIKLQTEQEQAAALKQQLHDALVEVESLAESRKHERARAQQAEAEQARMANERQAMAMERAELQIELLALKEQKAERRGLNPTVNTTVVCGATGHSVGAARVMVEKRHGTVRKGEEMAKLQLDSFDGYAGRNDRMLFGHLDRTVMFCMNICESARNARKYTGGTRSVPRTRPCWKKRRSAGTCFRASACGCPAPPRFSINRDSRDSRGRLSVNLLRPLPCPSTA